jgi:hypothetical protein
MAYAAAALPQQHIVDRQQDVEKFDALNEFAL